jgi:hypothetical protein
MSVKNVAIAFGIFFCFFANAQDVVTLKSGKVLKVKILGADEEYLNFRDFNSISESYLRALWENILSVKYRDTIYALSEEKTRFKELFHKNKRNEDLKSDTFSTSFKIENKQDAKKILNSKRFDEKRVILSVRNELYLMEDSAYAEFIRGVEDATKNYKASNVSSSIFLETLFLSVPTGLITTIVVSDIPPNEGKFMVSDFQKFQNLNYRQGYISAALKIKRKNAWGGFLGGVAANAILIPILFLIF